MCVCVYVCAYMCECLYVSVCVCVCAGDMGKGVDCWGGGRGGWVRAIVCV